MFRDHQEPLPDVDRHRCVAPRVALEAEFAVLDEDDESAVDTIRLADDYRVVQHDSTCGEAGMAHGQEVARTRELQRHPCTFTYDGLQRVRGQRASSETTEHLDFERDKAKGAREALQEQGLERRMLETRRFHGQVLLEHGQERGGLLGVPVCVHRGFLDQGVEPARTRRPRARRPPPGGGPAIRGAEPVHRRRLGGQLLIGGPPIVSTGRKGAVADLFDVLHIGVQRESPRMPSTCGRSDPR